MVTAEAIRPACRTISAIPSSSRSGRASRDAVTPRPLMYTAPKACFSAIRALSAS